jgi:DNA repair protein RadC
MTPELTIKKTKTDFPKVKITTSKDAEQFIRQFYSDDIGIYESFFMLLINRANSTVGFVKISQGGVAATYVDIKIIAKYIAETMCYGVILAHNHPSGNLTPSQQDKDITKKIKDMAAFFDCQVLDHIILTEEDYYSFADNGNL